MAKQRNQEKSRKEPENNTADVPQQPEGGGVEQGETSEGPMSSATATVEQANKSRPQEEDFENNNPQGEGDGGETPLHEDEGFVSVTDSLLGAVKSITDEIEECDSIIERAEARKEELQAQLRDTMDKVQDAVAKVQEQYGGVLNGNGASRQQARKPQQTTKKPAQGGGNRGGINRHGQKSVRALILEYLHRHGEARTSDIRQMLRDMGRDTNPGVELSRMVKDKSIVNADRGLYILPQTRRA